MKGSVLVVDDERSICIAIERLLSGKGCEVVTADSVDGARRQIAARGFDVLITDLSLHGGSGMELLRWVKANAPATAVVMITAYGSEKIAVEAMKLGAADYLPKPFDNDELELMVLRVLEERALRRELQQFREQAASAHRFESIIGRSAAMQRVFDTVRKVAPTDLTVLVRGPSGTGKELVARAIHYNSPRRARPIVAVNCAAVSRELVESELFGHERGAFTGAVAAREGKFEVADGSTLFLDEVGDMPRETQAKILRVLQERELERVGGNRTIKVDVRVIAATNQDLEARVRDGSFREDLYYRLNVVPVVLPSLSERVEDLPLLIEHFLAKAAERSRRKAKVLSPQAYAALLAHEWRGNVRELENALEQATALARGEDIGVEDLALKTSAGGSAAAAASNGAASFRDAKQRVVEQFERRFLSDALARHGGNVTRAAAEIGLYRQQLQAKLAEYGIDPEQFRE
jgi:DNA-binding NtrC family response regulator